MSLKLVHALPPRESHNHWAVMGDCDGQIPVGPTQRYLGCVRRNSNVQESIQTKKLAKRTLDKDNSEENKAAYKTAKKEAKRNVAIAKARAYDRMYADMDTTEGQKKVLRMAKEREKNSKAIYQ